MVPQRLVKRIVQGEYIDMAELLKDNLEVERRRALTGGEGSRSSFTSRAERREVPDIMSWLHCYSMFAASSDVREGSGQDKGNVGLSGPDDWGGSEVWWPRLADVRLSL